jgi:hypothetical protein
MTAVFPKHVRRQIVAIEGQHTPESFAWSANDIKTDFCVGGICSGQHTPMTAVLIANTSYAHRTFRTRA